MLAFAPMPHRLDAERLEQALRGADLALWDADFDRGLAIVNARWHEMLGLPAGDGAEVRLTQWLEYVHPDDREQAQAAEMAHRAGRTPSYEAVYRLRHADGHWVWVLDRGRVIERDAGGRALRMCGTHLDISGRVHAEEALRRSEQDLQVTLQCIGDGVITTDARGCITRINPVAERLTGWRAADALGCMLAQVFRIVDARSGQAAPDPVARVLAAGEAVTLPSPTRLVDRMGGEHEIADSAAPIRRADGELIGVVLVFSDVSAAYRTQQALHERERELAMLVAHMPGLVSRVDGEGVYLFASAGYERWFGRPVSQIVGRTQREVIGEARHAALSEPFARVQAGETVCYEAHVQAVDGDRYVLGTMVPDRDDDGRVRGQFTFVTDISERKRAEEALQAVQQRLAQAHKLEALGTLAGGIAHDFNNIVGGILGQAELALHELPPDHPAAQALLQIQQAGRRARATVQQILAFSRGGSTPSAVIDLRSVVAETCALLMAQRPAGVQMDVDTGGQPLPMVGDAAQMHQVLLNLCLNAWQALPEGRGRVRLRLWGDAHEICLQVADDGMGIAESARERIFDPFFTTKPSGEGTGLGLAVVHGIVQAHGGRVVVESAPGQGATFTLHFTRSVQAAPDPVPASVSHGDTAAGRGQHVLYVDDDELMREVASRILQRAGWRVSTCTDAAQALALLDRAADVALLVSDLNMPGDSGLTLCAAVRRRWPALPLVLSTGHLSELQREQAQALGVREVIAKARTVEDLAAAVARAL